MGQLLGQDLPTGPEVVVLLFSNWPSPDTMVHFFPHGFSKSGLANTGPGPAILSQYPAIVPVAIQGILTPVSLHKLVVIVIVPLSYYICRVMLTVYSYIHYPLNLVLNLTL